MGLIKIGFEDFKQMAGNKRVYYYEGEDFIDLHYLVDGFIIKTSVLKSDIDNFEMFASDKLFYQAVALDFQLEDPKKNLVEEISGIRKEVFPKLSIQDFQPHELKQEDIQQDAAEPSESDIDEVPPSA